jgi:hypothetical protein
VQTLKSHYISFKTPDQQILSIDQNEEQNLNRKRDHRRRQHHHSRRDAFGEDSFLTPPHDLRRVSASPTHGGTHVWFAKPSTKRYRGYIRRRAWRSFSVENSSRACRYCNTRRARELCLDGVSYGESRDVQARIFGTGGPPPNTVFNGSTQASWLQLCRHHRHVICGQK